MPVGLGFVSNLALLVPGLVSPVKAQFRAILRGTGADPEGLDPQVQTAPSPAIATDKACGLPQLGRYSYELVRPDPGVFGSAARGESGTSVNLPYRSGAGDSNLFIVQTDNHSPVSANVQRVSRKNLLVEGVSADSLNYCGTAAITPNQESVVWKCCRFSGTDDGARCFLLRRHGLGASFRRPDAGLSRRIIELRGRFSF